MAKVKWSKKIKKRSLFVFFILALFDYTALASGPAKLKAYTEPISIHYCIMMLDCDIGK